jgi:hypothetical protein
MQWNCEVSGELGPISGAIGNHVFRFCFLAFSSGDGPAISMAK